MYLAWQAHLALAADDSALRLRLAAYAFALVIGVMNYSHYMAAGWRPTFAAVTFGLMSVSSPWLWSVHSRRVSRDALKARQPDRGARCPAGHDPVDVAPGAVVPRHAAGDVGG